MNYQEIAKIRQQQRNASLFAVFFGQLAVFFSQERLEKDLQDHQYLLDNCPNQNWQFVHLLEFILPDDSIVIGNVWAFEDIVGPTHLQQVAQMNFGIDDCQFRGGNAYYIRYLSYEEAKAYSISINH